MLTNTVAGHGPWWARAALGALAVIASCCGEAGAQGQPLTYEEVVRAGKTLAERLCSTCHVVDDAPSSVAQAGVPSIRGIANRPDQTAERIRNVLINPHPPMPDIQISSAEIDRLLAYIDSLRLPAAGAPLTPRKLPATKPTYPDPS